MSEDLLRLAENRGLRAQIAAECLMYGVKRVPDEMIRSIIIHVAKEARASTPVEAGALREALAARLCDDFTAREIAGQEYAPSFEESADHVQDYWRALAEVALSQPGCSESGGWLPIETAPYLEVVRVKAGAMSFEAILNPGVSEDAHGNSVDQWQSAHEGEHPPCWSEGACWASNQDEMPSLQPTHWMPLPSTPSSKER